MIEAYFVVLFGPTLAMLTTFIIMIIIIGALVLWFCSVAKKLHK